MWIFRKRLKKKVLILFEIFLPDESERKKKFNLFLCTTWHGPDCLFVQVKHRRRIFSGWGSSKKWIDHLEWGVYGSALSFFIPSRAGKCKGQTWLPLEPSGPVVLDGFSAFRAVPTQSSGFTPQAFQRSPGPTTNGKPRFQKFWKLLGSYSWNSLRWMEFFSLKSRN